MRCILESILAGYSLRSAVISTGTPAVGKASPTRINRVSESFSQPSVVLDFTYKVESFGWEAHLLRH